MFRTLLTIITRFRPTKKIKVKMNTHLDNEILGDWECSGHWSLTERVSYGMSSLFN